MDSRFRGNDRAEPGDIYMDGQDEQDREGHYWPPYGPPAQRGDGRNVLRPYGGRDPGAVVDRWGSVSV